MRPIFISIFILFALFNFSCKTAYVTKTTPIEDVLSKYKGDSKNQIIREFGPPDKTNTDGNGGEVYTYEKNQQIAYRHDFEELSGSITTVKNTRQYVDFYFNRTGSVYLIKSNYPDVEEKVAAGKEVDVDSIFGVILLVGVILAATMGIPIVY